MEDDDSLLWEQIKRQYKPIAPARHLPYEQSKLLIKPRVRRIAEQTAISSSEPKPIPLISDRKSLRNLQRSQHVPFIIDLHHFHQPAAANFLLKGLCRAIEQQKPWGLIITGKGGPTFAGVIRKNWLEWLESSNIRPCIRGYAQAAQNHGGLGAFYIVLR